MGVSIIGLFIGVSVSPLGTLIFLGRPLPLLGGTLIGKVWGRVGKVGSKEGSLQKVSKGGGSISLSKGMIC